MRISATLEAVFPLNMTVWSRGIFSKPDARLLTKKCLYSPWDLESGFLQDNENDKAHMMEIKRSQAYYKDLLT